MRCTDSNCKTCFGEGDNCNQCYDGYYLTSSKTCDKCGNLCKTCSDKDTCNTCIDNSFLLSSKCYQCNIDCKTTSDNCRCDTCNDNYYIKNFQCLNCDDKNCKTCLNSGDNCVSCNNGYDLLPEKVCIECKSPCKTCSSINTCSSCIDNYFFLSSKCYHCNVDCKTTIDNCKCDTCNDGYYIKNYQCLKCDSNCKTCEGTDKKCLSCNDGYYLDSWNSCSKCIEPCKTCLSADICFSCLNNYFLLSGNCYQCNFDCKTSYNNCKCISCNIGYYFYNYQCFKCDSNCKSCKGSFNECSQCFQGKYLLNNKCLDCNANCKTCKNETFCTSCNSNKYISNNLCLDCDTDTDKCFNQENYQDEISLTDNEEEIQYYDEVIENIESVLLSKYFDTSLLDEGDEEIIETKKMKIILTTIANQNKSSKSNDTLIYFGECESLLREHYHLTNNQSIYIKKIEVIQKGMKIPKLEYSVYSNLNGTNLEQLNLSICKNMRISLLRPMKINEDIDLLNSASEYYNDLCYTTTSENGTDIILIDRRKEFIENNKTICQDDCIFSDYNNYSNMVNCSCKINIMPSSFANMNINKTKLYQNFVDIKNIANVQILTCYNKLFNKNNLLFNIGSYILISIIIFHIISLFIFYSKQLYMLINQIKDIISAIKKKRKNKKKKILIGKIIKELIKTRIILINKRPKK